MLQSLASFRSSNVTSSDAVGVAHTGASGAKEQSMSNFEGIPFTSLLSYAFTSDLVLVMNFVLRSGLGLHDKGRCQSAVSSYKRWRANGCKVLLACKAGRDVKALRFCRATHDG